MEDNIFYDGTKLLSLKDQNNNTPEIYILDGNRTAGKTTFFNRLLTRRFLKDGSEFLLLYRDATPLSSAHTGFFDDIRALFFQNYEMTQISEARGAIRVLMLNEKVCGYAVSMRSTELVKRMSHMFSSVKAILMDELQPENGLFNQDEVGQLFSIHTSVARGGGKMVRYVPVYLIGNSCSIINPYYCALGIHKRLRHNTKFLKGDGWVMEHNFNENAMEAQESSAFNRAFSDHRYAGYAAKNVYLNDNLAFVGKMSGNSQYLMTFKNKNKLYALRRYEDGIIYVDDRANPTFPTRIVANTGDHNTGFVLMGSSSVLVSMCRNYFNSGAVRFKNLECKDAFFDLVSIQTQYAF